MVLMQFILSTEEVKKFCPIINTSPDIRYPVLGGTLQRRAGTARHDAVAWGYARGADEMGVDIIQNCEVKGIKEMVIMLKVLKQQKVL